MLKEWNPRIAEDAIVTYTIKLQNQNGTPINLTGSTIRSVCEDPNAISVQINNCQSIQKLGIDFTYSLPNKRVNWNLIIIVIWSRRHAKSKNNEFWTSQIRNHNL